MNGQTWSSASRLCRMLCISLRLARWSGTVLDQREWREIWHLQREHEHPEAQSCEIEYRWSVKEVREQDIKSETYSRPLRSLISSSHASSSHHGITTTHLLSSVGTTSFHSVTTFKRDMNASFARSNISCWMVSRSLGRAVSRSARGIGALAPVSRRTESVCFFSISIGPSSRRSGTP